MTDFVAILSPVRRTDSGRVWRQTPQLVDGYRSSPAVSDLKSKILGLCNFLISRSSSRKERVESRGEQKTGLILCQIR